MFLIKPILWYDPNRISQEDMQRLIDGNHFANYVVAYTDKGAPPLGVVCPERYPTPDELFRWEPKA